MCDGKFHSKGVVIVQNKSLSTYYFSVVLQDYIFRRLFEINTKDKIWV